jgi:LPXTG-motif cell wall-anchored protein
MAGFHPAAAQAPAPCRDNGTTSPYAGAKAGLAADKNAAAVGEQVQLSGCGYRPNSTVGLTMHSHTMNLGTVTANANGEFTFTFPVPPDAEVGAHTITATGVDPAGVNRVQNLSFTVTAAQVATTTTLATTAATTASTTRVAGTSTTLPATGSGSTVPSVAGGIALVGVGTGLVIAARRRRQRASTASA